MTAVPSVQQHPASVDAYIRHGWSLVPIPMGTKGPTHKGWNLKDNALKSQSDLPSFTGALVDQFQVPANAASWTLDMGAESTGVYFVQMELNGFVATHKLVKVQ